MIKGNREDSQNESMETIGALTQVDAASSTHSTSGTDFNQWMIGYLWMWRRSTFHAASWLFFGDQLPNAYS